MVAVCKTFHKRLAFRRLHRGPYYHAYPCAQTSLWLASRTHQLATAFSGSAKVASHYRRIQQFFKEIQLQQDAIARFVVSLLPYDQFVLSMDRTNWMLGCFAINFVGLSVVHQRTAFPLFWILLPKKGNSNTKERIQLMNQLLSVFGTQHILYLTGDREFIGKQWFDFLIENQIPFRLRIKKNMMISRSTGQLAPAQQFFRSLLLSRGVIALFRKVEMGKGN